MAKELPYFRFTAQEWQNGDISLERLELKGLFIDVCCYYWIKDCSLELSTLIKKFNSHNELIHELIDLKIIKIKRDNVCIPFLDNQMSELLNLSEKRKKAGASGGKKSSRWNDVERKKGSQLYVLLFNNDDEIFIKIGTTTKSISERYSVPNDYNITTIYQYFSNLVVDLEIKIQNQFEKYLYTPNNKFGGYTESFSIDCISELKEIAENECFNVINDIDETISKLQANYKQTTSYKDKDKDKDKDKYKDKDKDKDKDKFSFKNSLLEFSKNETLIDDWLLVRKNKKATNSKTAFDLFIEQVKISDIPIDEILKMCIEKSWSGYKFEWIKNLRNKENAGQQKTNSGGRKADLIALNKLSSNVLQQFTINPGFGGDT